MSALYLLILPLQVFFPLKKQVVTVRHCKFLKEDTAIPRVMDPNDPGPACQKCNSKDEIYPSRVLLCDCSGCPHCQPHPTGATSVCNEAWHMSCLPQPLYRLPRGDWYCPNCTSHRPALNNKRSQAAWESGTSTHPGSYSLTPHGLCPDIDLLPHNTPMFSINPPLEPIPEHPLTSNIPSNITTKRGRVV